MPQEFNYDDIFSWYDSSEFKKKLPFHIIVKTFEDDFDLKLIEIVDPKLLTHFQQTQILFWIAKAKLEYHFDS